MNLLFPYQHGEAEDIRRVVVNALIDHLVCFVACMMHHMSGDAPGSVICRLGVQLPVVHHQVSHRHWWVLVVTHTSSVVLSRPVLSFALVSSVVVSASFSTAGTNALNTSWNQLHI